MLRFFIMRVSNPFSMSPSASSQAIQSKSNKHSNLERNGQLTLIESIEGTPLHAFLEGCHGNSERIEAGLNQLGTNLLGLLKEHLPDPIVEIGDTITPASLDPNLSEESNQRLEKMMDFLDQEALEDLSDKMTIEEELLHYTEDIGEMPSKGLRIVSGNEYFYDDAFNFNLHPPIKDVDASLVMNADMLDEKDNPNLPLEIKVFEMVLTHLFQNKLLNQEQLKRMLAYETEDKADQGIGFIPMVTQKGDNVRLIRRFDRSLSVDA
jgi:hypothetical protein